MHAAMLQPWRDNIVAEVMSGVGVVAIFLQFLDECFLVESLLSGQRNDSMKKV